MAYHDGEALEGHMFETFVRTEGVLNRFVFNLEETGRQGWGYCRMIRIEDTYPDKTVRISNYDPALHTDGHYMATRYRCRYNPHSLRMKVFGGGGNPPWDAQACRAIV
jgi:hypothetical protein